MRFNAAGAGPDDELRQVHPPVAGLAVVEPALRPVQVLAQLTLRQAGLLTQGPQEPRQMAVKCRVLGLGRHLTRLSGRRYLTRVECQTRIWTPFRCRKDKRCQEPFSLFCSFFLGRPRVRRCLPVASAPPPPPPKRLRQKSGHAPPPAATPARPPAAGRCSARLLAHGLPRWLESPGTPAVIVLVIVGPCRHLGRRSTTRPEPPTAPGDA